MVTIRLLHMWHCRFPGHTPYQSLLPNRYKKSHTVCMPSCQLEVFNLFFPFLTSSNYWKHLSWKDFKYWVKEWPSSAHSDWQSLCSERWDHSWGCKLFDALTRVMSRLRNPYLASPHMLEFPHVPYYGYLKGKHCIDTSAASDGNFNVSCKNHRVLDLQIHRRQNIIYKQRVSKGLLSSPGILCHSATFQLFQALRRASSPSPQWVWSERQVSKSPCLSLL